MIANFDLSVVQFLFAMRSTFGVAVFAFVSDFAGAVLVVAITLVSLWLLHSGRRWDYAAGLFVAVSGSAAAATLLKYVVERPRPPLYMHAVVESSYSFPSSHSAVSLALYGFLAYSAEHLIGAKWRALFASICVLLIAAIGFSRLYLGVHYPTDVIGGYAIGALFLWAGIRVEKALSRFAR